MVFVTFSDHISQPPYAGNKENVNRAISFSCYCILLLRLQDLAFSHSSWYADSIASANFANSAFVSTILE